MKAYFPRYTANRILPLETPNSLKNENRSLGFIKTFHMQQCSLQGCIRKLALASVELDFLRYHNRLNDLKGNNNKNYNMIKYGETFYGRHTVLNTSCSEVKPVAE